MHLALKRLRSLFITGHYGFGAKQPRYKQHDALTDAPESSITVEI